MELMFLIITSIIFLFFFLHSLDLYRKRGLPPGPIGLPIIGNLLQIGPKPHESLAKLAKKHGPFMTIRLGNITTVVVSTPAAAREILQHNDDACSGRVMQEAVAALNHPEAVILWMPIHETWRAMRKAINVSLTNQKKLDSLTDLRHNVVADMLNFVGECGWQKSPVDIGNLAFGVALNMMSNTIFSQNVTSYESKDVGKFKMNIDILVKLYGKFNIADMFPMLKPLDPQNIRRQAKVAHMYLEEVVEGLVSERLKHRDSKLARFGDMLDSLLDNTQDNESKFNLVHIKSLIVDLFIAGADTTSSTTTWTMAELLRNPAILSRVRKEVVEAVKEDGNVNEIKILNMSYLHAVIKETMRLHVPAPLLAPHKTEREVKLGEYIVPSNTKILVNAWAVSRDPDYWENPMVFMPERFFEKNVDYKGQHFEFIPFGSGKRRCPGMHLAPRMVSLIVASLVYHFDWELPHGKEEIDMDDVFGLSISKATPLVATPVPLK